jgi:uncharacterized membrane protein
MLRASAIANRVRGGHQPSQGQPLGWVGAGDINISRAERWGSALGGAALAFYGLKRRSLGGVALSAVGATLIYRGLTGHCGLYEALGVNTARGDAGAQRGIHVEKTVTILTSPEQLYRFWRRFENLPCFMWHVESVRETGDRRSHWVAKGPFGATVEWDAEITADRENELIAWRSLEGARLPNAGCVRFRRAAGGRGTEVYVLLNYYPPLGKLGATVAKFFGQEPGQQLAEDLRRLKRFLEAGEIPTTEGQPSGRIGMRHAPAARRRQQRLEAARAPAVQERVAGELFMASAPAGPMFDSRQD